MTFRERHSLTLTVLLAWAGVALISSAIRWTQIQGFILEPDDYLRLAQVRDWMAGQGWFDLVQYRFNPPHGGDMHWSRLVDLPIAGGTLLLSPLLGPRLAEWVTIVAVPLFLLLAAMMLLAHALEPLTGRTGAVFAAVLAGVSPPLMHQFAALRIDHHGWQILMSALCLWALLRADPRRSGLIAGVGAAFWVHVSIEALPYLAMIGGLLGVRYWLSAEEGTRLRAYVAAVTGASLLFFVATKPPALWLAPFCDAVSPPYLAPMIGVFALVVAGSRTRLTDSPAGRVALLAAAGGVGLGLLLAVGPQCLASPFASLDPLVQQYWYRNVLEGMPIWDQAPDRAVGIVWMPLVGAIGTWLAWRSAALPELRRDWATVGLMLAGAFVLSLLVQRAEAVANLYALGGCAVLLLALLAKARRIERVWLRIPMTAAAVIMPSPAPAMLGIARLDQATKPVVHVGGVEIHDREEKCATPAALEGLSRMPPRRLLATFDIGPALLAVTPHSSMSSGYHRHNEAMRSVLATFLGTPGQAEEYVRLHQVDMVVVCLREVALYRWGNPDGFAARLADGRAPAWLEPVELGGESQLRAWRVVPEA